MLLRMMERSINWWLSAVEPPHLMPNQFQSMVPGASSSEVAEVHRQDPRRLSTVAARTLELMSRKLELTSHPMVWFGDPFGTTS